MGKRIAALDGLRGLAVLLVVGFHAAPEWIPAGSYGVTVFFVLSGYLITSLLMAERERTERVSLLRFYRRRAIRLSPPLILVLGFFVAISLWWDTAFLSLFYTANYAQLAGHDMGLITHTWSLAVEEHFYLLWPPVIALAGRPERAVTWLFTGALTWRLCLLVGGAPTEWLYMATDANAYAVLAGCWLAIRKPTVRPAGGWAVAAVVAVSVIPWLVHTSMPYAWFALVTVGLSTLAVGQAVSGVKWLESPVLVWFGKISYSLYLWHFVLFFNGRLSLGIALPVSIALAWLTWRLIEQPLASRRARTATPEVPDLVPATSGTP